MNRLIDSELIALTADDIQWEMSPLDPAPISDDLLTDALIDAESYRTLAQQAIHGLHDLQQRHDRLVDQHHRLREELRARDGQAT
jgi:hypothetical protein